MRSSGPPSALFEGMFLWLFRCRAGSVVEEMPAAAAGSEQDATSAALEAAEDVADTFDRRDDEVQPFARSPLGALVTGRLNDPVSPELECTVPQVVVNVAHV